MEKAWNLKREKKREWKSERKCERDVSLTALKNNFT